VQHGIDAMLGLVAHRPHGDWGGGILFTGQRVGHAVEGAHDLELPSGLAGQIDHAVAVAGAELTEGEFGEYAGFAEASGSFEQHEGMAFEGRGQVVKRGFLAGAGHGEGRAEAEAQTVVARRAPKREKFYDALELDEKRGVIGGREGDGLREA
jgi:hypothetical protein